MQYYDDDDACPVVIIDDSDDEIDQRNSDPIVVVGEEEPTQSPPQLQAQPEPANQDEPPETKSPAIANQAASHEEKNDATNDEFAEIFGGIKEGPDSTAQAKQLTPQIDSALEVLGVFIDTNTSSAAPLDLPGLAPVPPTTNTATEGPSNAPFPAHNPSNHTAWHGAGNPIPPPPRVRPTPQHPQTTTFQYSAPAPKAPLPLPPPKLFSASIAQQHRHLPFNPDAVKSKPKPLPPPSAGPRGKEPPQEPPEYASMDVMLIAPSLNATPKVRSCHAYDMCAHVCL